METDYKELYEREKESNRRLLSSIKRLNSLTDAYRTHLEIFEQELFYLKNNLESCHSVQKDDKFNVFTPKSFITLATVRVEKNTATNYVLVVFDLDDFKHVNDTYGHYAGDLALKSYVDILRASSREEIDLIGRFGGDEFMLLLENIDYENAINRINAILNIVASTPIVYSHDGIIDTFYISASAGMVDYDRKIEYGDIDERELIGLTEEEKITRKIYRANFLLADEMLYKAKKNGKNQLGGTTDGMRTKMLIHNHSEGQEKR